MTKYKTVVLNRLYNGLASIRDYVWEDLVRLNMGIRFECNGAVMEVSPERVKLAVPGKQEFSSKFDGTTYHLVDFKWIPDAPKQKN